VAIFRALKGAIRRRSRQPGSHFARGRRQDSFTTFLLWDQGKNADAHGVQLRQFKR